MSGWILLDKPEGMSSNRAMCKIRGLLGKKTGYVGTLDPFAQGMLPIAVGEARKFIQYVDDARKEYTFDISFGYETDTLDRCGRITVSNGFVPTDDDILGVLENFVGVIEQIPPIFSAINIHGERAYRLALSGADSVQMVPRNVEIFSLKYLGKHRFNCVCSKGTYIRSLVRDICHKLGTYGHTKFLRRERISFIDSKYAKSMENIEEEVYNNNVNMLPIEFALTDISAVTLSDEHVRRLQNGLDRFTNMNFIDNQKYRVFRESDGKFCGIVEAYDGNKIRPLRMCIL